MNAVDYLRSSLHKGYLSPIRIVPVSEMMTANSMFMLCSRMILKSAGPMRLQSLRKIQMMEDGGITGFAATAATGHMASALSPPVHLAPAITSDAAVVKWY